MTQPTDGLVELRLVPVEVFTGMCSHQDCAYENCVGYGISDAVSAWSDCNRAVGRIYRIDEPHNQGWRQAGDTVAIYVKAADLPWFQRKFGEGFA